jgi:hypothetical protein
VKIKLSSIYASSQVTAQPGSIIDVSDEEGQQLVAGRFGIEVPSAIEEAVVAPETPAEQPKETAAVAAPETAAVRTGGRGSRARTTAASTPAAE